MEERGEKILNNSVDKNLIEKKYSFSELCVRTYSAFVLMILLISSLINSYSFYVCLSIISGGIMYEWLYVAGHNRCKKFFIIAGVLQFLSFCQLSWKIVFCLIELVIIFLSHPFHNFRDLKKIFIISGGAAYTFLSLYALGGIYDSYGFLFVFWMFLSVWLTDTGAFLLGKVMGKRKLAPRISPGKTWAGFYGGILVSISVCTFLACWIIAPKDLYKIVFLTFIMSLAAHLGDLLESAAKRYLLVKDMGSMIPGHGGMADRFDSLLMVSLIIALLRWCFFKF